MFINYTFLQEWATEGYQLWMVKVEGDSSSNILQLDFVKSPLSVNPCMVSSALKKKR